MPATEAATSTFLYTIFIRTTPERLWEAFTSPEFTKQYWFGMFQESAWTPGSTWSMQHVDRGLINSGAVLEADKPYRLVLRWQYEADPEIKAEGDSRMTLVIEPTGDVCKLTVTHEMGRAESKLIALVSGGWPRILSSLKSLLETGEPHACSRNAALAR